MFTSLSVGGFVEAPYSTTSIGGVITPVLVSIVIAFGVRLVKVWLLGNFDVRGQGFRRQAITGLVGVTLGAAAVGTFVGGLLGYGPWAPAAFPPWMQMATETVAFGTAFAGSLVTLLVVLGLVWLVRVRETPAEYLMARPYGLPKP